LHSATPFDNADLFCFDTLCCWPENSRSAADLKKLLLLRKSSGLFSEGKSPRQVAIELNLREAEVTELYKEYWNLKNLHDLNQVYEEIKDDIYSFAKLYKLAKEVGMNAQHVVNLLAIANNDLPSVEYRCERLKREEASLKAGNHNSARTLKELFDLISTKRNTLEQYATAR
jgi:hypothetical protein